MSALPSGTVTFLFTDIEGSTKLAQDFPEQMPVLLARHHEILNRAIQAYNGYCMRVVGDSFTVAFHTAQDALQSALDAQRTLQSETWSPAEIKVRMGIHTGQATWMGKDHEPEYEGYATLAMASRVMSAGHGGQILVSHNTYELTKDKPPADSAFTNLGEYHLKDFTQPQNIYQLTAPNLAANFPPLKTLKTVQNNLPLNLTSFIGRERELAEAQDKLVSTRLLTLIGPGGTGKTRLSLQVAAEQVGHFKHGVWFVELASLSDPAFIVPALAGVFNLREVQGMPLIETVTDYLRAKEALLIFDNCEHLVEASAKLADQLLHTCPQLKFLASSREALGINGEAVYRVPSLKEDEATRLFTERATKANSSFQATESNASFIAQICSRLDGIPLAIELAAARVNLFSPQQIAERLDDRFKLLTGGSRTALPRQQTLRALIDWSYQTLNETEQRAMRRLAVFSGGWTFEAAEAVVGESEALDGLAGLVNKSLVNVEEQAGKSRYSFLETIRQYAMDKLLESGEAVVVRDNHLNYCLRFFKHISEKLFVERKKLWFELFELENDNLRSALKWSVEQDPIKALTIIDFMPNLWMGSGRLKEGQAWCKAALEAAEKLIPHDSEMDSLRARGLHSLAGLLNSQGEHRAAREVAEKAIALFRQLGDTKNLADCLVVHGTASGFSGDIEQAIESLHESEKVSRDAGLKFELAFALMSLAYIFFETRGLGAQNEIDVYMQEGMALLKDVNHPWGNQFEKEYRARRAFASGDIATARKYANEVLAIYEESGATVLATNYKSNMAHALRRIGNFGEAIPIYQETMLAYQRIGHRGAIAHQLECFAFIAIAQEQGERAVKLLSAANALRERVNSRRTPQEQMEYEKQIADLQAGLGEGSFDQFWAEGKSMTMEQAIELALRAS